MPLRRLQSALLLTALLTAGLPLAASSPPEPGPSLTALRSNWETWELSQSGDRTLAAAHTLAVSQQSDGCWSAVDYADQKRSGWLAAAHLDHLNTLATAARILRRQNAPESAMDHAAVAALRCWLAKDPHNPNWWWNEIGTPKALGRAALLLQPLLTPRDLAQTTAILQRSKWSTWTGQNLVWGVDIQLMRGLLTADAPLVQQAFTRMNQEVRILPLWLPDGKPGEGIQSDGSFHQHGAQLYSGGYGLSFADDAGRDLVLSWNTPFQAPAEVFDAFAHFMLDGQQWMMRSGVFDFIARGREITRQGEAGATHTNAGFLRVVQSLAALPIPRRAEYQRFAAALAAADGLQEPAGNRAFWNSDFLVHKRAGYSTSVRMLSTRSKNEELINSEGTRSVHLADGANLLYKSGQEYSGIFPVWDWNLIPGTTAVQCVGPDGVPVTGEPQPIGQMGRSPFAGEVSDGTYGAAAMLLQRGPLTAKKAWFFFDDLYVALGTGITANAALCRPDASVVTTIEQNLLRGDVTRERLPDGRLLIAHNGTGYLIATPAAAAGIRSGPHTGRWSDIGTGPSTPVTLSTFTLTLDHGAGPHNAAYQYIVFPIGGLPLARHEASSPTLRVLANREDVQAVADTARTKIMAVFYQPASLQTPLGTLRVSAPAMLLVRHEHGITSITASNPLGAALDLTVTLDAAKTTFHLPGGPDAGRSTSQRIPQ